MLLRNTHVAVQFCAMTSRTEQKGLGVIKWVGTQIQKVARVLMLIECVKILLVMADHKVEDKGHQGTSTRGTSFLGLDNSCTPAQVRTHTHTHTHTHSHIYTYTHKHIYTQEAGRAGRDGLHSECLVFYARRDCPRILNMLRMGKCSNVVRSSGVLHLADPDI